jgi:hypothetical protein
MKEWKLIGAVILSVLFFSFALRFFNKHDTFKLIAYYPESIIIEQGNQKMVVDGKGLTQFILSNVRVIVSGDTLKSVNCEMIKR